MSRRARRWRKGEYRATLARLFKQNRGLCEYCRARTTIYQMDGTLPPDAATVDHVVPVAKGGTNMDINLALACLVCNGGKADMSEAAWMAVIEARRAVG